MGRLGVDLSKVGPTLDAQLVFEAALDLLKRAEKEEQRAWRLLFNLNKPRSEMSTESLLRNWETCDDAVRHAEWLTRFFRQRLEEERGEVDVERRACRRCRRRLPLTTEYFSRDRNRWWKHECKDCRREYDRQRWLRRKRARFAGETSKPIAHGLVKGAA